MNKWEGRRMKKGKTISVLLLILLPPAVLLMLPIHATTITSINPTSGPPGAVVRLIGEIDTPGGYYRILGFDRLLKEDRCETNSKLVNSTFTVPEYPIGSYTVQLKDNATGTTADALFTVITMYTVSAPRTQEGLNTTITVSVVGGINSTAYQFNVTVTDPQANQFSKIVTTPSTVNGTGFASALYYGDFPAGANTDFNGTYSVAVDETYPVSISGVATGSFDVGLTDKTVYKRFETVNIRGSGYNASETVTVDITFEGESVNGYPKNVTAFANGSLTDSWTILPKNASLGTYTVSLTGICVECDVAGRTVKSPADLQNFTVVGTDVLTVTIVDQPSASYQRTETARMNFTVTYPDDTNFTAADLGTVTVGVYHNATFVTDVSLTSADFDSATNKWMAKWKIPKNATLGTNYYFAFVENSVVDKEGNSGPSAAVSSDPFTVLKAVLDVTITDQPAAWYNRTATATMRFIAQFPDDTKYTSADLGSMQVRVYKNATNIANVTLTAADFDSATDMWTAEWLVPWDAGLGIGYKFIVYVDEVVDEHGNSGPADAVSSSAFEVVKAVLSVPDIHTDKTTYERGQVVTVHFTATYLDGSAVTTGSAVVTLTKADGSTAEPTAAYVSASGRFEANYTITTDDPLGTWTAQLATQGLKDGADNTGPIDTRTTAFEVIEVPPVVITAQVEIHPEALNLKSKGRWITVYIELPEGYSAADINVSTIRLDGVVPPETNVKYGFVKDPEVRDRDGDVVPELMVKFSRDAVIRHIRDIYGATGQKFSTVALTITGEVAGTSFEGSDTLKVIR